MHRRTVTWLMPLRGLALSRVATGDFGDPIPIRGWSPDELQCFTDGRAASEEMEEAADGLGPVLRAPGRLRRLQDRWLMRGPTLWALRPSLACAVCVLGMCAQAPVVAARDVWVDHDSRGGPCDDARTAAQNSMTAPWCTLAAAGNKAEPGDTVRVRGGEYTERHGCGDGCWNL